MRTDMYDKFPDAMGEYLSKNGWHFNKKLCEWAVSKMKDRNGNKVSFKEKSEIASLMSQHGVTITRDFGYDIPYAYAMAMADYYGSSLNDTKSVLNWVKDYIDDKDGVETRPMDEFYGRMIGQGVYIDWDACL